LLIIVTIAKLHSQQSSLPVLQQTGSESG